MYDWGNSAFATTVVAGLFPIFFEQYWANNLDSGTRTFWLGVASSVSSLAVVLLAPLLGSIADRGGLKKRFLAVFTALGVLATAAFYWVGQGEWMIATVLFTLGSIGFQAGTSFYDSLIVNVAGDKEMDQVSSLGYGLGYLGGGGLFALNVVMVLKPGCRFCWSRSGGRCSQFRCSAKCRRSACAAAARLPICAPASASCSARYANCACSSRCGCFCSRTGCTSTASTRSSAWRSTMA
jgi:MFS family permease